MRLAPIREVGSATELIAYLRKLAARMARDENFRATLPSVLAWFDRFISQMPSYARQAITCGGRQLTTVQIRGNKVYGFIRGVHVGTSWSDRKPVRAGSVTVADNHLSLRKPGEKVYVPMGLFVGNADTIRIQRNTLDWAERRTDTPFNHGIRVWGSIGKYLMIAENRIAVGRVGICVRPDPAISNNEVGSHLWLAADNLVDGVGPGDIIRKPGFMRVRDNWPV
jgi:hypothetical protein